MVVLGEGAVSYERGTPIRGHGSGVRVWGRGHPRARWSCPPTLTTGPNRPASDVGFTLTALRVRSAGKS